MDAVLSIFVTWQFLVLCIGITAITFIFRTTIEYFILNNPKMPGSSGSRFWTDLALPLFPIIVGMIFVFIAKSFPYPSVMTEEYSKFLFSISAGLLSPTLYRVIKALLWKDVNNGIPSTSSYNPPNTFPAPYSSSFPSNSNSSVDVSSLDAPPVFNNGPPPPKP